MWCGGTEGAPQDTPRDQIGPTAPPANRAPEVEAEVPGLRGILRPRAAHFLRDQTGGKGRARSCSGKGIPEANPKLALTEVRRDPKFLVTREL